MRGTDTAVRVSALAVLGLVFNAFTWGVSWWPMRQLNALGLHALWTTVITFSAAVLLLTLRRPKAWRELLTAPSLWVLVAAAGTTNACFNWAVTSGDVVRVVLLFYLAPLWSVLLARWLLNEAITPGALARIALALTGAMVVLWPADGIGLPWPSSLAEVLAIIGGASFALNNVMLRREAHRDAVARALAMFGGGVLVGGVLAVGLGLQGAVAWPPAPQLAWMAGVAALAVAFIASNLALLYGAARLPAHLTAVILVCEVLFASFSAVWLGAGSMTWQLLVGGSLIVAASLLAAWQHR